MNKYKILHALEDIVKEASIITLHDACNEQTLEHEDSLLIIDGCEILVWERFLGTKHAEEFDVRDLGDDELEALLDLLFENKVISQRTYDHLIC